MGVFGFIANSTHTSLIMISVAIVCAIWIGAALWAAANDVVFQRTFPIVVVDKYMYIQDGDEMKQIISNILVTSDDVVARYQNYHNIYYGLKLDVKMNRYVIQSNKREFDVEVR